MNGSIPGQKLPLNHCRLQTFNLLLELCPVIFHFLLGNPVHAAEDTVQSLGGCLADKILRKSTGKSIQLLLDKIFLVRAGIVFNSMQVNCPD